MSSFRLRPARADDAAAVADTVAAHERLIMGSTTYSVSDLEDEWRTIDLATTAWVVEDGGRVVAYGSVEDRGELWRAEGHVHPEAFGRGLGAELARFLETEVRTRGARRVQSSVLEGDLQAQALLAGLGYRPVRTFREMRIVLEHVPLPPAWPDGLVVTSFDPERDARAFHGAQQEAFADHWEARERSFDDWSKYHLEAPDFTSSLWTVVSDGDEIAAGVICRPELYGGGWVDVLFTRTPWRRRGLGAALLIESFGKFWAAGQPTVGLGVDAESRTGAFRLYERMGMKPAWAAVVFEKQLDV